ncbi:MULTISPECIES: hypothetical protein [Virgibacillus]|nr:MULTISPECIES: hypothetical protein [Virgibacillus]MBS7427349.1 hypothetical protein [Virgibacillus sp. 19R1-5]MED3737466.1 hypothetical protein [Virgibacillus pantothenticus]QTY16598.1 hypothetical protein KBP50_01105 [Virgibacillus pantothenticus]
MKEVETKLMMGADDKGNIIGKELRSGAKGQLLIVFLLVRAIFKKGMSFKKLSILL